MWKGCFPALREAANTHGVPEKKIFTAYNWVAVGKEVSQNEFVEIGLSITLQDTFKMQTFSPPRLLKSHFYSLSGQSRNDLCIYSKYMFKQKRDIKLKTGTITWDTEVPFNDQYFQNL